MRTTDFKSYLKLRNINEKRVKEIISNLEKYREYLQKENDIVERANFENLIKYTEHLVVIDKDSVLNFLIALMNYANFVKKNEIIEQVIDISESYNAMDTLFSRLGEYHGEKIRDKIFSKLTIPPLGIHPDKKPEFTKIIFKKLDNILGEEEAIRIISPCLHGRPPDDIEGDKKALSELGLDAFLLKKRQDLIENLEKHKEDKTLEFAQTVDNEVINFVRRNPSMGDGIRKGNIIYQSKLPYQIKKFLNEDNKKLKRFYICYCPWIRSAIKNGTEQELPNYFCHCSAGWYKLYWDQIFEQPVKVEPVKTALNGAMECEFAVYLPKSIMESKLKIKN